MILGDDPNKETGFARVVRNLLMHWHRAEVFESITVWGIGYWGMPHEAPATIYPAASPQDGRWESIANLQRLVDLLTHRDYTHLFILNDLWAVNPLAKALTQLRKSNGLKSYLYFPVDAPLEPEWLTILENVDLAAAYTPYGQEQVRAALMRGVRDGSAGARKRASQLAEAIEVIPHGVEKVFRPAPETKAAIRAALFNGKVKEKDFLLVNVNTNQRRKGIAQSLQVLAALKRLRNPTDPEFRMYLHMPRENKEEGICYGLVARQLGLEEGRELFYGDANYVQNRPKLSDEGLNELYNAADLYLSTSLGEGWGLGITEAMAAGLPVAAPCHTAIIELIDNGRGLGLPIGQADVMPGDNSRLRPRVKVEQAAELILIANRNNYLPVYAERAQSWVGGLEWDWIAGQWLTWMGVPREAAVEREGAGV